MKYYEHHLGDYMRSCAHLSLLEHGVYRRLLDVYYSTEATIPAAQAERLVCARTHDERAAVAAVLSEFFTQEGDQWRHSRCDAEIDRYREKQDKARKSAESRWNKPAHSEGNADAMRTHSERSAKAMLTNNQEPITIESKECTTCIADSPSAESAGDAPTDELEGRRKRSVIACPVQRIADLWDEVLPELRSPIVWNDARKTAVSTRWREMAVFHGWKTQDEGVDWFRRTLVAIRGSPFLMGKVQPRNRDQKPFALTLDWMFGPKNFLKIVEGRYHEQI